ncbi:MAG: type 1 glutamine amidotransferase domain-containing protein [Pseudobdellovibrionaceae bacterium]
MFRYLFFALFLCGSVALADSTPHRGKVLVVVTNESMLGSTGTPSGIHFNELTHPVAALRHAGFDVELASILGGVGPIDPATLDRADPFNKRFYNDQSWMTRLSQTKSIATVNSKNYVGIFLVGGVSTMWDFPNSPELNSLIATVYERGGVIAAVCHGPAALVNVKLRNGQYLVAGKKISAFTDEEETIRGRQDVVPFLLESRLRLLGAKFAEAEPFKYHVISDGRLVTGQNPASAFGVAHEMIHQLSGGKY